MGDESFRLGLIQFIRTFKSGSVTLNDLVAQLDAAGVYEMFEI